MLPYAGNLIAISCWMKALGSQHHAFPFRGTSVQSPAVQRSCPHKSSQRGLFRRHAPWYLTDFWNEATASRRRRQNESKEWKKDRLTLLMEYVVVDDRALPVGGATCATIFAVGLHQHQH